MEFGVFIRDIRVFGKWKKRCDVSFMGIQNFWYFGGIFLSFCASISKIITK